MLRSVEERVPAAAENINKSVGVSVDLDHEMGVSIITDRSKADESVQNRSFERNGTGDCLDFTASVEESALQTPVARCNISSPNKMSSGEGEGSVRSRRNLSFVSCNSSNSKRTCNRERILEDRFSNGYDSDGELPYCADKEIDLELLERFSNFSIGETNMVSVE